MAGLHSKYGLLGLALSVGGGLFAAATWLLVGYMPLVALGIATIILGIVSLALSSSQPQLSAEASIVFLETGLHNLGILIEELGIRSRAIYLPPSITDGQLRALIPLKRNPSPHEISRKLNQRLIVRFGTGGEDTGLLVATPIYRIPNTETVTHITSSSDLEEEISSILVTSLDLAESVHVEQTTDAIFVDVTNPVIPITDHLAFRVLGSPIASLVATIAAQALDKNLTVIGETEKGKSLIIELKLYEAQQV